MSAGLKPPRPSIGTPPILLAAGDGAGDDEAEVDGVPAASGVDRPNEAFGVAGDEEVVEVLAADDALSACSAIEDEDD
jgi:hypothetical protein